MSRPQRLTSRQEAQEILRKGEYGVLCTVSGEGQPYGVPINYCCDEANGNIYLHCAVTGQKLDNLAHNSKVSFTVVTRSEVVQEKFTTRYESAIVTGTAQLVEDEQEKVNALNLLCDRLAPGVMKGREEMIRSCLHEVAIIRIAAQTLTGKRNGAI